MSGGAALIELLLVYGVVIGFGVWQLRSLRRDGRSAKDSTPARHPEGQEDADPVRSEPVEGEALMHGRDRPPE